MTAISGFVIAYNRASLLRTCLRSLRFVDELIVIDKSSTDDSPRIARRYADRVITVPWSPTVEETRGFALDQCRHDWIAFLDDDEMLSPEAIEYLHAPRASDAPDAVALPLRHWILGAFDADAYYWPEHQIRFFRKGAVAFGPLVHGGIEVRTDRVEQIPADFADLDRAPVACRTPRSGSNGPTATPRVPSVRGADADGADMIDFAHRRIDHWLALSRNSDRNDYRAAVALLRAIYDMVDRVKAWETERDGRRRSVPGALRGTGSRLRRTGDAPRHRDWHASLDGLRRLIGRLRC